MNPKLNVTLFRNGREVFQCELEGKLEVGRQTKEEPPPPLVVKTGQGHRLIAADIEQRMFPRSLLTIQSASNHRLLVTNVHPSTTFFIVGVGILQAQQSKECNLPVNLKLPDDFTLSIAVKAMPIGESGNEVTSSRMRPRIPTENLSPLLATRTSLSPSNALVDSSSHEKTVLGSILQAKTADIRFDPSMFIDILDFVVIAAQKPATSSEFYQGIAEALTRLIEVDRAEVILREGGQWIRSEKRAFASQGHEASLNRPPSTSMLNKVLQSKDMVLYPDPTTELATESVRDLVSAVAYPIHDEQEQIIGVLYADRLVESGKGGAMIEKIEETLINVLATAIANGIAKSKRENLVTTYQQFFSAKIMEAIRKDPNILEGEDCEVSVLFCDVRGFSRITDQIGPAKAMEWMRDTLSELSEQVQELDGVLVDYVGDELFAMWGAPDKDPTHAFKAASAAQRMMKLAIDLSAKWKTLIPDGFAFGIGICTGQARVGNTGSIQKFKYGPMGRTVNLGSRIQGLTKQWRVETMIDEETASRLPADMPRRRLCQARVVGMEGVVSLYELAREMTSEFAVLKQDYEAALGLFEAKRHREAAQAFSDLARRFPDDGPSLLMLVRAVSEVAEPSKEFDPAWKAPSK